MLSILDVLSNFLSELATSTYSITDELVPFMGGTRSASQREALQNARLFSVDFGFVPAGL